MIAQDLSDDAFTALTAKIATDRGFGCASYKNKCLRRRIAVRMRARGVDTYAEYAHVLDSDHAEYDKLLDALTINVTKLFRNWETYSVLREQIVPALWDLPDPVLNVWSSSRMPLTRTGESASPAGAPVARAASTICAGSMAAKCARIVVVSVPGAYGSSV